MANQKQSKMSHTDQPLMSKKKNMNIPSEKVFDIIKGKLIQHQLPYQCSLACRIVQQLVHQINCHTRAAQPAIQCSSQCIRAAQTSTRSARQSHQVLDSAKAYETQIAALDNHQGIIYCATELKKLKKLYKSTYTIVQLN